MEGLASGLSVGLYLVYMTLFALILILSQPHHIYNSRYCHTPRSAVFARGQKVRTTLCDPTYYGSVETRALTGLAQGLLM